MTCCVRGLLQVGCCLLGLSVACIPKVLRGEHFFKRQRFYLGLYAELESKLVLTYVQSPLFWPSAMATSVYEIHAGRRNFAWRPDQLLQAEGRGQAREVVRLAEKFANNRRVSQLLTCTSQMQRTHFKETSNEGYVYVRSKPRDLGNYVYTVLYDAAFRVAKVHALPALPGFRALEGRYPSLGLQHPPTRSSVELKSDVVEAILADSRLSGDGPEIRTDRIEIQSTLREFSTAFGRLLRRITCEHDGAPCMAAFPPPTMLCKLLFAAVGNTEPSRQMLKTISALISAERPWNYEVGAWTVFVDYALPNKSPALAGEVAEGLSPATPWQAFSEPSTNKKWYWNKKSGAFFFADEPGDWQRYLDEEGNTGWYNSTSAEWFHDI